MGRVARTKAKGKGQDESKGKGGATPRARSKGPKSSKAAAAPRARSKGPRGSKGSKLAASCASSPKGSSVWSRLRRSSSGLLPRSLLTSATQVVLTVQQRPRPPSLHSPAPPSTPAREGSGSGRDSLESRWIECGVV